jgi:hypothetical protein
MLASSGAVLFYLIVGAVLTFILGIVALAIFRREVERNMTASSANGRSEAAGPPSRLRRSAAVPIVFQVQNAAAISGADPSGRILRQSALVHAISGFAFAIVAALLLLLLNGTELTPLRVAAVAWAYAWPVVLSLSLLVGPDRGTQGRIVLCYLGGLFLLCCAAWFAGTADLSIGAATEAPAANTGGLELPEFLAPAALWLLYATPSLFLLLFLNRTIRNIGPLVLVFVIVALLSTHIALSILAIDSVMRLAGWFGAETGLGAIGVLLTAVPISLLAGSWPAWRCVAFIRDRYADKQLSDLMLTVSAIWLLQTLVLASGLVLAQGAIGFAAAFLPFLTWSLALTAGLGRIAATARTRPARHLLLLRVFGFGRRSRRMLDLLGARWRFLGSIEFIAAPDLASRMLEPSTFLEFVRGRLGRLFVRSVGDLRESLAGVDRSPDPDGRFRINQLFCSGEAWKAVVMQLMGEASLVVMDLRGFEPERRGCVFELQTLLDTVHLSRLVLLVDDTTDRGALEHLLVERWRHLDVDSPNLASTRAELLLLDAARSDAKTVRTLLAATQLLPHSQPDSNCRG